LVLPKDRCEFGLNVLLSVSSVHSEAQLRKEVYALMQRTRVRGEAKALPFAQILSDEKGEYQHDAPPSSGPPVSAGCMQ
jgi:hypothetical protein